MALVSYRTQVNALFDVLWKHLLEKVKTPEKFIPAVTRSEILGRPGENTVDRLVYLDDGTGDKPTREIITSDIHRRSIVFKMTDNPVWSGFVTNTVMDAVLQTKELAEAEAAKSLAKN